MSLNFEFGKKIDSRKSLIQSRKFTELGVKGFENLSLKSSYFDINVTQFRIWNLNFKNFKLEFVRLASLSRNLTGFRVWNWNFTYTLIEKYNLIDFQVKFNRIPCLKLKFNRISTVCIIQWIKWGNLTGFRVWNWNFTTALV